MIKVLKVGVALVGAGMTSAFMGYTGDTALTK